MECATMVAVARGTGSRVAIAARAALATVTLAAIVVSVRIAHLEHARGWSTVLDVTPVATFAAVGAVIGAARPRQRVGWAMSIGAAAWAAGSALSAVGHYGIVTAPGRVPDPGAFVVLGAQQRALGWYVIILVVPAVFPDVPLREHPKLRAMLAVLMVTAALDPVLDPVADTNGLGHWHNPLAPPPSWGIVRLPVFLGSIPNALVCTVVVVVLLVRRWQRGDAVCRQQIALFAVAAAVPIVAAPIALSTGGGWIFGLAALPLPIAIAIAMLARGLYDIRTAVHRGLVWALLSACVVLAYAAAVAVTTAVFHVRPGTAWPVWVAAAAVAIGVMPARIGLQRGLNRLLFGRWDEPYDVLAGLGQLLEATADTDRLLSAITDELEALGLREVTIRDQEGRTLAGRATTAPGEELTLLAYGVPVGSLHFDSGGRPLRARDRRLVDDLAGPLGAVLHARRLNLELQRTLDRLVRAREEERRRLRRDLHDGLGPALAGHLLRLDLLAAELGPTSPAGARLDALRADLRVTVLDLRRVVEGLRPPALDELGLATAIEEAAHRLLDGSGVRLELAVGSIPALPAAVEVAAYRIATEATTNILRHAGATRCRITIDVDRGCLTLAVDDDGRGLPADRTVGHGLQTMRERAEELGGELQVLSTAGTCVEARLPVGAPLTTTRPLP